MEKYNGRRSIVGNLLDRITWIIEIEFVGINIKYEQFSRHLTTAQVNKQIHCEMLNGPKSKARDLTVAINISYSISCALCTICEGNGESVKKCSFRKQTTSVCLQKTIIQLIQEKSRSCCSLKYHFKDIVKNLNEEMKAG